MAKKSQKTLFLPVWIQNILDKEGEKRGGPGVIAAAAIYNFSRQKVPEKKSILKSYRAAEVDDAYSESIESPKAKEIPLSECAAIVKNFVRYKIPTAQEQQVIESLRQLLADDSVARANAEKLKRKKDRQTRKGSG